MLLQRLSCAKSPSHGAAAVLYPWIPIFVCISSTSGRPCCRHAPASQACYVLWGSDIQVVDTSAETHEDVQMHVQVGEAEHWWSMVARLLQPPAPLLPASSVAAAAAGVAAGSGTSDSLRASEK